MVNTTRQLALALATGALAATSASAQLQDQRSLSATPELVPTTAETGAAGTLAAPITPNQMMIDSSIYYEDFRDGIDDWTIVATVPDTLELWEYLTDTDLSNRTGQSRYPVFASPTADNGFLWFEYISYADPLNPDSPPYRQLTQSITSPTLDLTDADPSVAYALNWYSYDPRLNIRQQNVSMSIQGREDETTTVIWTIPDAFDRPNTAPQRNVFARIPADYIGQDSVQITYTYDGDYYGWGIDDIFITALPNNEVSLDANFLAKAPYFATPVSQIGDQNIYFVTDVDNNGGAEQTPRVTVEIVRVTSDTTSELYYRDSLDYPALAPDASLDNNVFQRFVGMPTEPGEYVTTYTVSTPDSDDDDVTPGNNSGSYNFFIVAQDSAAPYFKASRFGAVNRPSNANDPSNYEVGNIYYTPNLGTDGLRIDSIEFGWNTLGYADESQGSGFYEIRTYGYRGDLNEDGVAEIGLEAVNEESTEFVRLATRFFEITAGTPDGFYDATIAPAEIEDPATGDISFGPVVIPSDERFIGYGVSMSYQGATVPGETPDFFRYGLDQTFDAGALDLVRDSLVAFGVTERGEEYSTFFQLRGVDPVRSEFNWGTTFFINTTITELDSVVNVKEELAVREFVVSPNPADQQLNISFDLGEQNDVVEFTVMNGVGQVVEVIGAQANTGRLALNTGAYNQGVFFVTAKTQDGASATRRFAVQR